jgi:hypothetical protein
MILIGAAALLCLLGGRLNAAPREQVINTIADIFAALRGCWVPPPLAMAPSEMQITVRLSFTRTGAILGPPRITYERPTATDEQRLVYRIAVMQMLRRCTPLSFTDALGHAIAGRPLSIRFVDQRKQRRAKLRSRNNQLQT